MVDAVHIPQDQHVALALLLQAGQRLAEMIEPTLQGRLIRLIFRLGL